MMQRFPNPCEERILTGLMDSIVWFGCTLMAILMWSSTSLLYKASICKNREKHTCLKYSVSVGLVFFVIAVIYLAVRDEPFTIWESAARYWPVTVFGFVYAIVNTISFNGYIHNEITVQSPVEGIGGGTSTVLLILTYLLFGRLDSVSSLLTPLRTAGILLILVSIISLSIIRNAEGESRGDGDPPKERWKRRGLGTLIFPVMFAVIDGLETIVTGLCLDTTYGYAMPEGDAIIIIGMEYAVFAFACWCYIYSREKKPYNPFRRENAPRMLGVLADNIGIVFYSYAMAINSVSTDPLLAVYPVLVMIGGRVLMKEKVSTSQYICLLSIIAGSIMVIADTIG